MTTQNKPKHIRPIGAAPVDDSEEAVNPMAAYVRPAFIGIMIVAVITVGYALWRSNTEGRTAGQWTEFNTAFFEANISGAPDRLSEVGERYPASKAGWYAIQAAGDLYLRRGIAEQLTKPEPARRDFERAKEKYETVLQAKLSNDHLLRQQAQYSLAYACELLGEIDEAHQLYDELLADDPDSPFSDLAERGKLRCSLTESTDFLNAFASFDIDFTAEAPGESLPERPDITYPELTENPTDSPASDTNTKSENGDGGSQSPELAPADSGNQGDS